MESTITRKLVQAIEDARDSCMGVQQRLNELRRDPKVNGFQADYLKARLIWLQKPPLFPLYSNIIPWLRDHAAAAAEADSRSESPSRHESFGVQAVFDHALLFCANALRELSRVMRIGEALVVDCVAESSKDWKPELWILESILASHETNPAAQHQNSNKALRVGASSSSPLSPAAVSPTALSPAAAAYEEPLWSPFYLVLRDLHYALGLVEKAYAELNEMCGYIFHFIPPHVIKKTLDHRLEKDRELCRLTAVKDTDELFRECKHLISANKTRSSSSKFRCASYMLGKLNLRCHPKPGGPTPDHLPEFLCIENNELEGNSEPFADGSFGYVSERMWLQFPVAVKTMKSDVLKDLFEEVAMLARVEHPHVVRLVGYCCIVRGRETTTRNRLVMQRMSNDLRRLMDAIVESPEFDEDVPFPAPVALDIIMQLAEALKFLRMQRVMHRDIKAKNILVNDRPLLQSSAADTTTRIDDQHHGRKQLQYYLVKLTDMGLSQYKLPENSTSASKMKGASNWRAPEVFAENTSTYDWAADVYSFAMACYEIVSGKTPFYDVQTITYKRLCQGERPTLPSNCQPELADLIRRCWETKGCNRPHIDDVCQELQSCKEALLRRYNDYFEAEAATAVP
jgi:hypothetical protein